MATDSRTPRLPFQRVAVTVPPEDWFHGIARALFHLYRQALLDLGLGVFDVPVETFLFPDAGRIAALLSDLQAFQPDLAIGLPEGVYALICRLPAQRDGWLPCLFTDILDIPTICYWDHAPLQFADQLLAPLPTDPAASTQGAMVRLRRALTHPRLLHWSRDSGQTRIMHDLGLLIPNHVVQELTPTLPGFVPQEPPAGAGTSGHASVSFVGHLYQDPPDYPHAALAALAGDATRKWEDECGPPLWDILLRQIAQMPADWRGSLALDPDQTYFWRFAHRLIAHQAQTSSRLKLLGAAGVPVTCYGNLNANGDGVADHLTAVPGYIPFGPPLAAVLARHPITIDVLNPGFIHGYSHKPVLGFAAGGFVLLNRKQDFVDAFGEAGEAVSYRDGAELAAKVDRFLTSPGYRTEVGDAMREQITARYQLKDVMRRVLEAAGGLDWKSARASHRSKPVARIDLLPGLRGEPYWEGASVEVGGGGTRVVTARQAWQYAASIVIPAEVSSMNEPHLRVSVIVEAGRIGFCILPEGAPTHLPEEHLISPTASAVTIAVELPRQGGGRVIVRNTAEGVSRALFLEAALCDRLA